MNIVDMHCDTISELLKYRRKCRRKDRNSPEESTAAENCSLRENQLHIDLKKMKDAGYLLQNFAMFIDLEDTEDPFAESMEMADLFYEEMENNADLIRPVTSYEEILRSRSEGKLSALLTLEEGGACKGNLALLRSLYRMGVRMVTLTWNYPNELGWPNRSASRRNPNPESKRPDFRQIDTVNGLTETGIAFVEEMERLGMIVDVSHLSDAGFYDVARTVKKPFVASHSNARAVTPWGRNLTDDMIRTLAEHGGVAGLNFCPAFLDCDERGKSAPGTIEAVVRHAKHIVRIGGIECLGLGSDFDGISTHEELYDASCMPKLADAFRKAGFSERETDLILGENVLRVYRDILK